MTYSISKQKLLISSFALGLSIFLPFQAQASLIITDFDYVVSNGVHTIDINGEVAGGEIEIQSNDIINEENGLPGFGGLVFSRDKTIEYSVFLTDEDILEENDLFLNKLSAGDTVDASWFSGENSYNTGGLTHSDNFFFADANFGKWDAIGAHGFVGFRIENEDDYNYGWLEVTRGSLELGAAGFETTLGAGAVIPAAVPLPPSVFLFASSFGLLAMRRRGKVENKI